jgi:hypothetical protein
MIRKNMLTIALLATGIAAFSGAYAASPNEPDGLSGIPLREAKKLGSTPADPAAGSRRELSGVPMNVAKRLLDTRKPAASTDNVELSGQPLNRAKRP